ncbi:MAG: MinD/ParA family protein [Acidobacteriota bacterium]|jgi:flagellar biosynthesis protein FlhG|nr:MinD/ParA family protein [Acidobacteriota bacterium]
MSSFDEIRENTKNHGVAVEALTSKEGLALGKKRNTRFIAVTSGKGGVGKTNIVANLSASLSELGKKVVVLDADFGLANLDVLLGLTPRYHLGHMLYGDKNLSEIMVRGPEGIYIIPASSGLHQMSDLTLLQRNRLIEEIRDLDMDIDYFIIDTAAGVSRNVVHFLISAGEVFVVSAPEPTAIVDAYAVIKIILAEDSYKPIRVIVNSVKDEYCAHEVFYQINSVVERFLNRTIDYFGYVERDSHVQKAVKSQMLVTQRFPNAPASRCFRNLAHRIVRNETWAFEGVIVEKLLNDWIN